MEKHAKYSPSKLPRITKCPGSISLIRQLKNQGLIPEQQASSAAAEEGTMLHKVMEIALRTGLTEVSAELVIEYKLTEEYVNACNECIDYIFMLKMQIPEGEEYKEYIEVKVGLYNFAHVYDCEELDDVYGTLDYVLIRKDKIIVLDWKFGKGIEVWPDSAQLYAYAIATNSLISKFYKELDHLESKPDNLSVDLVIGQPRIQAEHFKVFKTDLKDLYSWLEDTLVPALKNINSSDPKFCPGDDTCMWCPVKAVPHACEARFSQVQDVIAKTFKAHMNPIKDLPTEEAIELLKSEKLITKFFKDLHTYIFDQVSHGNKDLGYKMVRGRSTRVFKEYDDKGLPSKFLSWAERSLGYDATDFMSMKPMSAPQAEKFITARVLKGHPEFYEYIHKPEGKLTLVPDNDKREAVEFETAETAFAAFVIKPE